MVFPFFKSPFEASNSKTTFDYLLEPQISSFSIVLNSIHAGIRMDSALEIVFNPCSQTVGLRWATDGPISFFLGGSVFTSVRI